MCAFVCSQVFETNASRVKQLTETDFQCWQPDKGRLNRIKAKISDGFIKNFKNDDVYARWQVFPIHILITLSIIANKEYFQESVRSVFSVDWLVGLD